MTLNAGVAICSLPCVVCGGETVIVGTYYEHYAFQKPCRYMLWYYKVQPTYFIFREEETTVVTNTAHFYLSLCSIYVPITKLYTRMVFSRATETTYPLEIYQKLASGVIPTTGYRLETVNNHSMFR